MHKYYILDLLYLGVSMPFIYYAFDKKRATHFLDQAMGEITEGTPTRYEDGINADGGDPYLVLHGNEVNSQDERRRKFLDSIELTNSASDDIYLVFFFSEARFEDDFDYFTGIFSRINFFDREHSESRDVFLIFLSDGEKSLSEQHRQSILAQAALHTNRDFFSDVYFFKQSVLFADEDGRINQSTAEHLNVSENKHNTTISTIKTMVAQYEGNETFYGPDESVIQTESDSITSERDDTARAPIQPLATLLSNTSEKRKKVFLINRIISPFLYFYAKSNGPVSSLFFGFLGVVCTVAFVIPACLLHLAIGLFLNKELDKVASTIGKSSHEIIVSAPGVDATPQILDDSSFDYNTFEPNAVSTPVARKQGNDSRRVHFEDEISAKEGYETPLSQPLVSFRGETDDGLGDRGLVEAQVDAGPSTPKTLIQALVKYS